MPSASSLKRSRCVRGQYAQPIAATVARALAALVVVLHASGSPGVDREPLNFQDEFALEFITPLQIDQVQEAKERDSNGGAHTKTDAEE